MGYQNDTAVIPSRGGGTILLVAVATRIQSPNEFGDKPLWYGSVTAQG